MKESRTSSRPFTVIVDNIRTTSNASFTSKKLTIVDLDEKKALLNQKSRALKERLHQLEANSSDSEKISLNPYAGKLTNVLQMANVLTTSLKPFPPIGL